MKIPLKIDSPTKLKKIGITFLSLFVLFCLIKLGIFFYFNFIVQYKTDNFKTLVEFKSDNIYGLYGKQVFIHKAFNSYLNEVDDLAKKYGIVLIVNHSYRTPNQTLVSTVVPPAKFSNHCAGLAIDFNIISEGKKYHSYDLKKNKRDKLPQNIQNFLRKIQLHKNLRWGGDFLKEDPVHIDFPINTVSKKKWKMYSDDCFVDYSKKIPKWMFWK